MPLKRNQTIAIIGPLAADSAQLIGPWSGAGDGDKCVSLVRGFTNRKKNDNLTLHIEKGCDISGTDKSGFAAAIEKAKLNRLEKAL